MDLLSVFRTFRRHWLVALPVILLTLACLGYAVFIRPTDYEATASVALLSPPGAPRAESGEVITQTEAGKTDSPLGRFNDQSVVVNILSKAISTDEFREQLQEQGADTRYEVGPGVSGPIADITAIATTPEAAITTAQLVAAAYVQELQNIQAAQGVDPAYMITTLPVEEPENAKPKLSSTFRLAIAVVGLGAIATFFVVSLAEARSQLKEERAEQEESDPTDGTGGPPDPDPTDGTGGPPDPDPTEVDDVIADVDEVPGTSSKTGDGRPGPKTATKVPSTGPPPWGTSASRTSAASPPPLRGR